MDETLDRVRGWVGRARELAVQADDPVAWAPDADTASLLDSILMRSTSARDAVQGYYESFWGGVSPKCRQLHERAVDWLLADLQRRGIDLASLPGVEESSLFAGIEVPVRGGRRVTADLLVLLNLALLANEQLGPRRDGQVVLEVGGCYGELPRLLRLLATDAPPAAHVLLDIPEALAMSYLFLAQTFPGEPMLLASSGAELREADFSKYRFVFVPVALAPDLGGRAVDLLVSTSVLGGPQCTGITGWLPLAQQTLRPAKLLALDRYLNTRRPGLAPWNPPGGPPATGYDRGWAVLNWEIEPSYLRCPYATRLLPRCVQIIARRTPERDEAQDRAASQRLLSDVQDSLWCRHFDGDALEGTCWDNMMIHDGGMDGATFKLWESIRLDARPENIRLMIQHLDHLQRFEGKLIEETPFYEETLARLIATCADRGRQKEFALWMWDRLRDRPDPAAMANYLRVLLPEFQGQRIVCYGVGLDFVAMAEAGVFAGAQVVGLIDDRRPPGSEVAGYRVVATAELAELRPDVILATSSRFGAAIRQRAAGMVTALGLRAQVR